jgi:cell division initiation protein
MDLTARDVHEKQFHDAWRGYNQEEVDDFLDLVAENIDRLLRENESFQRRIQELDRAVSQSRNTEEMLKKTLLSAQKAANEAIATAKAKAEQLIADAEIGARRTGEEAHRRVAELDREHANKKRDLEASIERLQARENELKRRLSSFLDQQRRSLEGLAEMPGDNPPGSTGGATGAAPAGGATGGAPAGQRPSPAASPQPGSAQKPAGGTQTDQPKERPVADRQQTSPGERPTAKTGEGVAAVRNLFRREENQK